MSIARLAGFIVLTLLLVIFLSAILAICMLPDETPYWFYGGLSRIWVWIIAVLTFVVLTFIGPHVIWPGPQEPTNPQPQTKKS